MIKVRLLESKHVTKCQVKKETNTGWKKEPLKTIPSDQGFNLNPHRECLVVDLDHHPPMVVDSRLCEKHYQISLTLVAEMMWIQKFTGFSMHVVCHSDAGAPSKVSNVMS